MISELAKLCAQPQVKIEEVLYIHTYIHIYIYSTYYIYEFTNP